MPPSDATVKVEYVVRCSSGWSDTVTSRREAEALRKRKDRNHTMCMPHQITKRTITEELLDA